MNSIGKILGILAALSWIVFLFLDHHYQKVVSQAVSDANGTYGELYGPLSFFRPAVLVLSLGVAVVTFVLLLSNAGKSFGGKSD